MGSHQPFLININYHKIPLRIFLGGPTYYQKKRFKICSRSRSDLKMSNNKHLLLQRPFLININYHKIPIRIFLGGPTYYQKKRFKICSRSRSDLKMSNDKHLLLQRPFLININYHKIPIRIFVGDIRIHPMTQALAPPLNPRPHPTPLPLHCCPIFLPKPLPHPLSLGHLVTLGPPTPPNLNISTIRVRDPWVSIQIKFWASLLSTKEVLHTCKIVYHF